MGDASLAPISQIATRHFTVLREQSPQAEVYHLLHKMQVSRQQLLSKVADELLASVSNLAAELPLPGADPQLFGHRIGPIVYLLNILPPRDYDFDRQVLYTALQRFQMDTFFHSVIRVKDAAIKMANLCKLNCKDRTNLALACTLHDIGKMAVPLGVLDKPGTLFTNERKIMEFHQVLGYLLLRSIHRFRDVAEIMCYTHVEQGYPASIIGKPVPFLSHFLIIADTFDACLSYREYRASRRLSMRSVYEMVVAHDKPRHPLELLIAAARAYEINPDDAKAILGLVFTGGDDLGKIQEAFR